jgi:syntaxin 18
LEQARQTVEAQIALKKRAKQGLGALGRWAAGGAITAKSPEEEAQEAEKKNVNVHRESVIWYLRRKLEECSRFQSEMMEIRLMREVERSKSVLYKARGTMPIMDDSSVNGGPDYRAMAADAKEEAMGEVEQTLSPEQLQLFAQENQDMLKHYEDTLDQVRYVLISWAWSLDTEGKTQDGRTVSARDLGASNDAGQQSLYASRAH